MKITHIDYFTLRGSIRDDYPKPLASFVKEGSIFLRVYTDIGIMGIGEPSPYGAPLKEMINILREILIPKWIGFNPLDVTNLSSKNYKKIGYGNIGFSALEAGFLQALWDIFGKYQNKPLYKILNPKSIGKVKAYASAGMWYENSPIEEVVNEAIKYKEEGFNFYKLRPETPIGAGNHLQRNLNPPKVNLSRLIKLLKKIILDTNGKIKIMVDAGCRLNFKEAIYLSEAMHELDCFFLEEPIPRDYKQYSELKKKVKIAIAGGESLVSKIQFEPWVKKKALDYLQPDSNLAGINEILNINKIAEDHKLNIVLHNWANNINSATNIHLGAALNSCNLVETNLTFNPLKKDLLKQELKIKNGEFILDEKPGLGIEFDDSAIEKYKFNLSL